MDEKVSLKNIVGGGYKEFWQWRGRYLIAKGSRGSKKSTTASLRLVLNIMEYDKANALVVRKVFKDHRDSTYAQLKWAIHRLKVPHLWKCTTSPLEITYKPTNQKILFRGLDDPMSITSITVENGYLCWVWFEELFQIIDEDAFNKVDMSIRGKVPPPLWKQVIGTFNPWSEKHWSKKRFFDVKSDEVLALTTNYMCNEFLDEADIRLFEEMKVKNPRRYKVEGLGDWGIAEGLVFDNWEELDFKKDELIKQRPHIFAVFGLDFGYTTDPTGFICSLVDQKTKEIFVFDEHYQKGMLNNHIADMIKYKGYSKELIIADSAEPKSIEEIKRMEIPRIKAAEKGKDSINNGIQFLKQFKIYVHPSCTNTILELYNYAYETNKEGSLINKPIDAYNHLIDPLRYSVERLWKGSSVGFFKK